MTGQRFRQQRLIVAVLAVGLFVVVDGTFGPPAAARAAMLPLCENECGPGADCSSGCKVEIGEFYDEITCGDYNGGAGSNQCNTCNAECTVWSSPNQECWMGGSQSDCETDGPEYAVCGDGTCQNGAGGEGCDSCALDCGDCPEIDCGDFVCDPGETYVTCPTDCGDPGPLGFCGDGVCSEEDEEDYESCEKDCVTPNERCEDDFDCGSGYVCIPGGEPYGGQCVLFERIETLDACVWDADCDLGYVCRTVEWSPDPPPYFGRCVWFWEAYTR